MKWINDPRAVVRFGDVTLHEPARTRSWHDADDPFPFQFVVLSDGATFGDPEPESTEIPSALLDGTIVTTTRNNNRVVELTIGVESESGEGLARGERVLMGECNKARGALRRNSLTWLPPQPSARTTVYEVLEAHLEWPFDDEAEMLKRRLYRLVLTCAPFARGAEPIVTPAVDVGTVPVFEVVDDGSSTTGWSATVADDSVPVEGPPPGVTVESLRTNLIPNPRFEGFAGAGWTTGVNSNAYGVPLGDGSVSMRLDKPATGLVRLRTAGIMMPAVTPGQQYTASLRIDNIMGTIGSGGRLWIRWMAGGTKLGDSAATTLPGNPTGKFSVTATAPSGATNAQMWLDLYLTANNFPGGGGRPVTWGGAAVSEPLFEQSSTAGDYFDGDTPADGSTVYQWLGAANTSPSVSYVRGATALSRSGLSADLSDTPFLHVDYNSRSAITATFNGGEALQPVDTMSLGGGARRAVFNPGVATLTSLVVTAGTADGAAPSLMVQQALRSNMETASAATGRLASRTIDVRGTARAPASLELAHPADGLGDVILYTYEEDDSGYRPDLRRFWVSGGTVVADPTASSGQRSEMIRDVPEVFEMPVDQLPDGVYEILALVARTGTAARTFTWTTSVRMPGDTVDYGTYAMFKHIAPEGMGGDGDWATASLGLVSLPSVAARAGVVRFAVSVASDDTYLDDVLLCNVTTGDLTRVSAGDHKRLWVDSPTLDVPRRTIWLGNAEDRSDARHATSNEIEAWGAHQFLPGTVAATVKTDAISAGLSMRQYEWFMHNASTYDDEGDA